MIGVVHLHPHCPQDEARLIKFLEKHNRKYSMMLLGDLNIKPSPKADLSKIWFGNSTSKLGRIVCAANLHLGQFIGSTLTHAHRGGGTTLDYIMGPAAWSDTLLFSRVCADVPGSDHLPVMARWEIPILGHEPPLLRPKRVSSRAIEQCVAGMQDNLDPGTVGDVSNLTDTVQQRLNAYRNSKPTSLRRYWKVTGWLRQMRHKMKKAWQNHCIQRDKASWIPWRTLQLMWRAHCRGLRFQSWHNYLAQLSNSVAGNRCWYFKEAKKLMGKNPRQAQTPKLMDDGHQELEPFMIPGAIQHHFRQLYAPRPVHDLIFTLHHQHVQNRNDAWNSVLVEVTVLELRISLSNLSTQTRWVQTNSSRVLEGIVCD